MKRKILATVSAIVLSLTVVSSADASANYYYICKKGSHSWGGYYSPLAISIARGNGYACWRP